MHDLYPQLFTLKNVPTYPKLDEVFGFEDYRDKIQASFIRNQSKKRSLLVKRKNSESDFIEEIPVINKVARRDAASIDSNFKVSFKIKNELDMNDRSFEMILCNMHVGMRSQDGPDEVQTQIESSRKLKRKINQNSSSKIAKIVTFKRHMT